MDHKKVARILKHFGANVRKKRNAKGLGLRGLAYETDMEISNLSDIENGKTDVRLTTIHRLAEALGVDPGELMK